MSEQISRDEFLKMMNTELENRFSKARWNAYLKLYHALSPIALIYGGAPRDYVLRILAAKEYYEYCESNNIDSDNNYTNLKIHPESFKDRNKFPTDIDIFIKESVFEEFIKKYGETYNLHEKKKDKDFTNYFFHNNPLFKKAITHKKYSANFMKFFTGYQLSIIMGDNFKKNSIIDIDFVIIKDEYTSMREYMDRGILYPPFGNPDFDVNQLCFKFDIDEGFTCKPLNYIINHISRQSCIKSESSFLPLTNMKRINDILQNIIENIRTKKAVPIFPDYEQYREIFGRNKQFAIDFRRLNKMHAYDFEIQKWDVIIPFPKEHVIWAPSNYVYHDDDDKCLICYDGFNPENRWFKCCRTCNGRMHQSCFTKYLQQVSEDRTSAEIKCPKCRTDISYNCSCKYLTYFNVIDLFTNDDKSCPNCNKKMDYYGEPNCNCWKIKCCNYDFSPDPDLID